jgi:anti-sigma regulatory factor (Ser/Thr protein kinase)
MLVDSPKDQLELDSRLTELSRLRPWIEVVADRLGLAEEERFAINLCLEEALANIVLHGYRSEPGHPIVIRNFVSAGSLCITIDDHAPPFSPIESQSQSTRDATIPVSLESITPGGNGIRLLHRFAGSLSYKRLSDGNRLTLWFPVPLLASR